MSRLSCVVLLCYIGLCMANVLPRTQSFVDHELVPDILSAPPLNVLSVTFPSGAQVLEGNVVALDDVSDMPTLGWDANPDVLYTVIMCDPDAPSRETPERRSALHWLVVNVPNTDIAAGDTIFSFLASGPSLGTGLHRYVFLVYEQTGVIDLDLPSESLEERFNFAPDEFSATHNLAALVAGNFYQTERLESTAWNIFENISFVNSY